MLPELGLVALILALLLAVLLGTLPLVGAQRGIDGWIASARPLAFSQLALIGIAYAVFAVVLAWDYLAPRIKLAQARRNIALRIRRQEAKKSA